MANITLELEVISGPDKGRIFRVSGPMTIIGRDNESHIRLADPTISSKHARIELAPESAQILDLGSINKLQHNGHTVSKADLKQGDRITIGDTTMEVTINAGSPLDMQKTVRTGRRKGGMLILASSVLVLFICVYYGVQFQKEKQKQTTPLVANTFRQISTFGFRGLPQVALPTASDFSMAPTRAYQPKEATSGPARHIFYKFQAPKPGGRKGGYQDRSELSTASVLPPDPLSNLTYKGRNWSNFNPRIGNGRFLKKDQMVLGNYYVALVSYTNDNFYNKTPEALIGKRAGYDEVLGPITPLYFDFYMEVWDSLPLSAPMQNFALDLKSSDTRFDQKPLIPKWMNMAVDRNHWTKQDITSQWADFTQSVSGAPYMHFRVRQEKNGEVLAIFTGRDYDFQRERVDDVIKNLIENQKLGDPKRKEDKETLIADALAAEKEGDAMIPDLMSYKFGEMEFYKDKWNYFRAFNRYHRALCYLQVADKWSFDDDYVRVFAKAEKIYDYIQNENSFFMQTWKETERLLDRRDWKGAQKKNEDLYTIASLGMEPEKFPFLDEWFIYSHLVREKAARYIIQKQ